MASGQFWQKTPERDLSFGAWDWIRVDGWRYCLRSDECESVPSEREGTACRAPTDEKILRTDGELAEAVGGDDEGDKEEGIVADVK